MEAFWVNGPPSPIDASCLAVTPLRRRGSDDIEATGFFFSLEGNEHGDVFLVTCFHVLQRVLSKSDEWIAMMHVREGNGCAVKKEHSFTFRVPDDVVVSRQTDLAAVRVRGLPFEAMYKRFDARNLISGALETGALLQLPGYPGGLFDAYHNLPVVRTGSAAFDTGLPWNGDPSLSLACMPVFCGDSGAPLLMHQTVAAARSPNAPHQIDVLKVFALVGVHCGGYNPITQKNANQINAAPIPVGVFIKASFLRDIHKWKEMASLKKIGEVYKPEWTSLSAHQPHSTDNDWFESLISHASKTGTELDDQLWIRLDQKETVLMVEVGVGSMGKFEFDCKRLVRLTVGKRVFHRSDSSEAWPCQEDCLRFICKRKGTHSCVDAVFIFSVTPKFRSDMVVCGILCSKLAIGSDVPLDEDERVDIAWKFDTKE